MSDTAMTDDLNAERQQKAKEYARIRHRLLFVELGLSAVLLVGFLLTGLSSGLRDLLAFPQYLRVGLYAIVFVTAYTVVTAPLSFYSGYVLPKRFGLLTQSLRSWVLDGLKGFAITILFGIAGLEVLYWFLEQFPTIWWLLAAGAMLLFTVVLANLAPVLILPLFYKLNPLADEELVQRLTNLAARAGTRVRGVYTMNLSAKSTGANAALMGLGNTRRVVLTDTLLGKYSPEEIEVILAHELGHHVHHDIAKGIAVTSMTTLISFYLASLTLNWAVPTFGFTSIYDIAAFPLFAIVVGVFGLAIMPITNGYSRLIEAQADVYALEMTDSPGVFTSMMTKLVDQNLGEAAPAWWVEFLLYDHPTYQKRVAMARAFSSSRKREG